MENSPTVGVEPEYEVVAGTHGCCFDESFVQGDRRDRLTVATTMRHIYKRLKI